MDKLKNCQNHSHHSPLAPKCLKFESAAFQNKNTQKLDPNFQEKESRWIIKPNSKSSNTKFGDRAFLSISKQYEILKRSKQAKTLVGIEKSGVKVNHMIDDQAFACFCGKKYKLKHTFLSHIRQNHILAAESLDYLHNKQQCQRKMIEVPLLLIQKEDLLSRIKQSSLKHMLIPEELLSIIPSQQKVKIIEEANQILKPNISFLEKLTQNDAKNKTYIFTLNFRQNIKKIVIKCVQMFDRRVSIYIKNTNFKAVLNLFVFNLLTAISETHTYRNSVLVPWSALIENGCMEFLRWIDQNYIKIFKGKGIFHQPYKIDIQLTKGEKFTQKERVNKRELFTIHYLQYLDYKQGDKLKLKTMEFVLYHFVNWVKQKIQ